MFAVTNTDSKNSVPQIHNNLQDTMIRLNWLLHRRFAQVVADLDMTVPQFYTLSTLLGMGGSSTMGSLSRNARQVSATMTGIIDRLVRDGLVERHRDHDDRRSVIVVITPTGQRLVEAAWHRAMVSIEEAVRELDGDQLAIITQFADSLAHVLDRPLEESSL